MVQGTDDYILVKFQITVLGVGASMWGKELLVGGLASLECFPSLFSVSLEGVSEKPSWS